MQHEHHTRVHLGDDLPPQGRPERQRGGWLAKFAPGVSKLVTKRGETPENLWVKCPDTGEMLRGQLEDLQKLVDAYRRGVMVEKP